MSVSYNQPSPGGGPTGGPEGDSPGQGTTTLDWENLTQRFEAEVEEAPFSQWLDQDLLEMESTLQHFRTPAAMKIRRS